MIVVTSENIAGKRITQSLGLVRGNTIRARHIGKDIMAGLRNIVGGEIHEYSKLIGEAREQSIDRMIAEAEHLGANAVVATRFTMSVLMGGRPNYWRWVPRSWWRMTPQNRLLAVDGRRESVM